MMNVPHGWFQSETQSTRLPQSCIDLRNSFGPCLAISGNGVLLDASSSGLNTILGFNASPLFGTAHHVDAWAEDHRSDEYDRLRSAFRLQRHSLIERISKPLRGCPLLHPICELDPSTCTAEQLIRSYIQASMLDQFADQVSKLHEEICRISSRLTEERSAMFERNVVHGTSLALTFASSQVLDACWNRQLEYCIRFDREDSRTAVFHLNLSFREIQLGWFWQHLNRLLDAATGGDPADPPSAPIRPATIDYSYAFANRSLAIRSSEKTDQNPDQMITHELKEDFSRLNVHCEMEPVVLDRNLYPIYREQILRMQKMVYEPARQTPAEEFDAIFSSQAPVAILALAQDSIAGMALAGPIHLYQDVRGNATDPFGRDPNTLYMVDVTVLPDFRGGLGRILKGAVSRSAMLRGYSAIHGRNRDRMARGMWSINLSLGSYELQHLVNDYPDEEEFRDCLYYRCPLKWPSGISVDPEAISDQRISELVNGNYGVSE